MHTELSATQILISIFLLAPLLFLTFKPPKLLEEKNFQILLGFLVVSIVIIYPRFSFFHAQTALAVLVICYGYLLKNWKLKNLILTFIPTTLIIFIFLLWSVLATDWGKNARFYRSDDIKLAEAIKKKADGKLTFLFGLHSGLYAMADIVPPKRWTDNFGWYLEIPGVQDEILVRWDDKPPDMVLWRTPTEGNWFDLGTYQPQKIVKWIERNYNKKEELEPGIWLWVKN